jgi:hypothetical protein
MSTQSMQLASLAPTTSIGPFMVTTPSTSSVDEKKIRAAKKKPVLGGVRAILLSALVGSAVWYLIWEIGKHLLLKH